MSELETFFDPNPVRAIAIPPTFADVVLINGPCSFCGFSVRDASADIPAENTGQVTSPGAGASIISLGSLQAGTYRVNWQVGLSGTLAAGDANNFRLQHNSAPLLISENPAVAGSYPQVEAEVSVSSGDSINIVAIAAGTVGAVYEASLSIEPVTITNGAAEFQDGNNPLAETAVAANASETEFFGTDGMHVRNRLNYHPISGILTGVVYVRFQKNTG